MPGVPSSRGCDGCRKQKQKVILSQQKGIGRSDNDYAGDQLAENAQARSATSNNGNFEDFNQPVVVGSPSRSLANKLTRLISAFVSNIDESANINIQLPWNFGPFLSDVPRRLGANEALDAASEALVTSYTHFITGNAEANSDVLTKHSMALGALRRTLDDPVRAHSSETLCSTMILLIVQTLPGINGPSARSHSIGAAHILKGRGYTGPKDDFESQLLLSLRGPVIIEGLINSQVSMTKQQWRDLVYNHIDTDTPDGQMMHCMAQLPDLMYRGRCILRSSSSIPSAILGMREEVRSLRDSFAPHLESLRERWMYTDSNIATQYPEFAAQKAIIHAHFSRSYGLALAIGIMLNCVTAALKGDIREFSTESSQLSDEIVRLAEAVNQYRPLGTVYMVLCLAAAWVGAVDPAKRAIIEPILVAYIRDVQGPSATTMSIGLELLEKKFTLR